MKRLSFTRNSWCLVIFFFCLQALSAERSDSGALSASQCSVLNTSVHTSIGNRVYSAVYLSQRSTHESSCPRSHTPVCSGCQLSPQNNVRWFGCSGPLSLWSDACCFQCCWLREKGGWGKKTDMLIPASFQAFFWAINYAQGKRDRRRKEFCFFHLLLTN